jgi:integrase
LPAINLALQAESLGFLEASQTQPVRAAPVKKNVDSNLAFEKKNNFTALAEALLDIECERVSRQELSASSVGIQKNRLDAHILPFFRYIPPTQVTHVDLAGFVSRLTKYGLSSTTISQYFVLVRKLLKLATRQGLLKEVPEFPKIKVLTQPRSMLSLHEYSKLARTALRMSRSKSFSPEVKSTEGQRERFWVAPRNRLLAPDMFWAIRFMANSFVRPGDLRQLKHKHVTVVRGQNVYLRMNLPETKKHDKPMVSMQAAVQVYESLLRHQRAQGFDDPEDYLFLPAEKDRNYALAVLGFWFKWVMREAGLATTDEKNRPKTLYCLRHTSIMFRLLYGQGIDMLTLARNARTSVQMIERFYASSLDGEMNVAMIQSRRSTKTIRGPVNRV